MSIRVWIDGLPLSLTQDSDQQFSFAPSSCDLATH